MKSSILLLLAVIFFFFGLRTFSQCTPDPGCVDDSLPGQICPDILPDGTTGIPYQQVMTVIPPSSATIGTITVDIHKIVLTGIQNLPSGINYETNTPANEFYVDTAYCILLSGTPIDTGTYNLKIHTDVWIYFLGNPVFYGEVIDSTSYFIQVNPVDTNNISSPTGNLFRMLAIPNPFSESCLIGYYSPNFQNVTLKIFNYFGQNVYEENAGAVSGNNFFHFDGRLLKEGLYIYSVSNGRSLFNGRLIIADQ